MTAPTTTSAGSDEAAVAALPARKNAARGRRRRRPAWMPCEAARAGVRRARVSRRAQAFSLLSSTGWNSAVAFFSSVAGIGAVDHVGERDAEHVAELGDRHDHRQAGLRDRCRLQHAFDPFLRRLEVARRLRGGVRRVAHRRAGGGLQHARLVRLVRRPLQVEPRRPLLLAERRDALAVAEQRRDLLLRARRHDAVADLADDARLGRILERLREADAVEPHRGLALQEQALRLVPVEARRRPAGRTSRAASGTSSPPRSLRACRS